MRDGKRAGVDSRVEEILGKGRAAVKSKSLEDALDFFSEGLEYDPSDELKSCLLVGRVEVLIELGRYGSALSDCRQVDKLQQGDADAFYRRGICEDALGLHTRAAESLEKACELCGQWRDDWQKALDTARQHVQEQLGNFSWAKLYETPRAAGAVPPCLGTASFCNSIEIQLVPGHGRALVLTEDVAEGTLLFVSKAFVLAYQSELRRTVLNKLATCTQVEHDCFFCLYNGSNKDQIVPTGLNLEGRAADFEPGANGSARTVNSKAVDQILKFNTFAHDTLNEYGAAGASPISGVWFLPAFVNHSCRPNVQRTFLGDLMICRAARALKAGTELCDTYVSAFQPLHIRRHWLKAELDFECHCCRCVLEEAFLSKDIAESFLLRLNTIVQEIDPSALSPTSEAFDLLIGSIEREICEAVEAGQEKLESDARLKQACCNLWGDWCERSFRKAALKRLLCGSFLSVFKGAAFSRRQLREPATCAEAYRRCLVLLEEVSAGSAYHVHWAAQCALQTYEASRLAGNETPSEDVKAAVHAAGRWNVNCYGRESFRSLMRQQGWPKELCHLADAVVAFCAPGAPEMSCDEAAMEYALEERDGAMLVLSLTLPDSVETTQLDLDVGDNRVKVSFHGACDCNSWPLLIELPKLVDPERAAAAKFKKKGGRRLVLELPLRHSSRA